MSEAVPWIMAQSWLWGSQIADKKIRPGFILEGIDFPDFPVDFLVKLNNFSSDVVLVTVQNKDLVE